MHSRWIVSSWFVTFALNWSAFAQTTQPSVADEKVEPGIVKGHVTDAAGKPLAGVTVSFENRLFYHSTAETKSGKDGSYRVELTKGGFHPSARLWREFNDEKYHFDLCPDPADDVPGTDGGVVNFVWKMSGKKPADQRGEWGYLVVAERPPMNFDFESKDVQLTLVPDGPLVDGSAGRTIVGKLKHTPDGDALRDVPFGRYKISAKLMKKGEPEKPLAIRVRRTDDDFADSCTTQFVSLDHTDTIYKIEVEVKLP